MKYGRELAVLFLPLASNDTKSYSTENNSMITFELESRFHKQNIIGAT